MVELILSLATINPGRTIGLLIAFKLGLFD